jgi:hypothetical protein
VRSPRLADVDVGARQVRVVGKGGRERVVPVHRSLSVELTNYLRHERPNDSPAAECFVVLRGPTIGQALTDGMRKIFAPIGNAAGRPRVRPPRLRHTYGTDLAAAGMDLLVLRELMGHASPETTAGPVTCPRVGSPLSMRARSLNEPRRPILAERIFPPRCWPATRLHVAVELELARRRWRPHRRISPEPKTDEPPHPIGRRSVTLAVPRAGDCWRSQEPSARAETRSLTATLATRSRCVRVRRR